MRRYCRTYLDEIASHPPNRNGQSAAAWGLMSRVRLIPLMYALWRFTILPRDFSEAEGELTPSQKLKRKAVEQRYRAELDGMYREGPRGP